MEIKTIKIKELKAAVYNPRKWSDQAREHLTESIKKFGIVDPLIVNSAPRRKNILIGGHFRLKIAKELEFKEVPVVYVNIPNVEKEKELNLRLNKNTGDWDLDILKDFDVEKLMEVGFDDDDLSQIWDDMTEIEEDGFNVGKAVDEIKTPKTKPGEIYQLGKHRLMCGDSTKEEDVEKLMGGELADMVMCDPPYNIGLDYSKGATGGPKQTKRKEYFKNKLKVKDNKKTEEYQEFINSTIQNILKFTKPNLHIFYWCDEKYVWLMQEIFGVNEIDFRRVCIWIKNNFNLTPQIAFNKVYEPCVYGTIGKPYLNKDYKSLNEIMNREIESGNQVIDEISDMINIWLVKRDNAQDYEHPTQKPLSLNQKPMKRCTKPNDLIVDLFGGSGSTLLAAEQIKRRCYMIEQEPIFCDVIIKRWEEFTNQKAKLIK